MINNELMKRKEFKENLISVFELEKVFEEKTKYPRGFWKFLEKNMNPNDKDCDYYITLKMAEKTELLFSIDGIPIGIFNNKYIVAFNESEVDFDIVGDTESNWMTNAFGWGKKEEPIFQKICFENFGVPIKDFDPCDISMYDLGLGD